LGLTKELSSLALLGLYKKASSKVKLEMLALIEVLKHTEKTSQEAITLIYKLERVPDSMSLISKLSKLQLDAKVLAATERMAMAPKQTPKASPKTIQPPVATFSFFEKYKTPILSVAGVLTMWILIVIFSPSKSVIPIPKIKREIVIRLVPQQGHKFVSTRINDVLTSFLLDTGASTTTVSIAYLNTHIRSGFINRNSHYLRKRRYRTANGEAVIAEVWQLPSMTIGPKTIYNVEVAAIEGIDDSGFLLGMSTINKLGKPTIDLANNKIVIK
jgi:clan AA aspartic protease (TIGR02281 family)